MLTHAQILFLIGLKIVNVEDSQLQRTHHKTCGVDAHAAVAIGEQLLNELILTLL